MVSSKERSILFGTNWLKRACIWDWKAIYSAHPIVLGIRICLEIPNPRPKYMYFISFMKSTNIRHLCSS
jgi:hypothetical protein